MNMERYAARHHLIDRILRRYMLLAFMFSVILVVAIVLDLVNS